MTYKLIKNKIFSCLKFGIYKSSYRKKDATVRFLIEGKNVTKLSSEDTFFKRASHACYFGWL